jgi:Ca2+-binding RTX toxin-like protein
MADYVLEGPRWRAGAAGTSAGLVTWAYDSTTPASFLAVLSAAFADWSSYGNISFQQVSDTGSADITIGEGAIDGLNGTLGVTNYGYAVTGSGQTFTSAAITFDSGEGWQSSGSAVLSDGNVNLFLVALHEIGHAIGLDHYDATPAIMNTYLNWSVADLTTSEVDGIQALYGASTTPPIQGTSAADRLVGTDLNERVVGDAGDDTLYGAGGRDVVYGNLGADLIYGNLGGDVLFGGQGDDVASGGQGNDVAYGNLGADVIYGNLGSDVLFGGQGSDTLYGGQGSDTLLGGTGPDLLVGGAGADLYVFGPNSGHDLIVGFSQAGGDRLSLGGQSYTMADDAQGGTLLVLSGGGTVDLAGVTGASVTAAAFV